MLFTAGMLLLSAQIILVFPATFWLGRFAQFDEGGSFLAKVGEAWNGLWLLTLGYLLSVSALGVACWVGFRFRGAPKLAVAGAVVCWLAVLTALLRTAYMWSQKIDTGTGAFLYRYLLIGFCGVNPGQGFPAPPNPCTYEKQQREARRNKKLEPADRVRLKALAAVRGEWPWKIMASLPLDRKTVASALAGFVLICLLMRPGEIAEAFESPGYKIIYWILLYSCLLLVCYLATQIVSLWLEFRKQLRAIENVPFRRGFSDLKTLTWKPLWKLAGTGREKFSELLNLADCR